MKTITENKIFEKAFREMEIFENPILNDDIHVTFFITSTLKSLSIRAIWLALTSVIYS